MNRTMKRAIIESWYLVDYSLYKTTPKKELKERDYMAYLTSKGAFMSNLFEMYNLLKFQPKDRVYNNFKEMIDYIEDTISISKDEVKSLMEDSRSIESLKGEINEIGKVQGLTETSLGSYVVSKRQKALILDSVLLKTAVQMANKELIENWKFKVLYDSHKLFRDALIDHCYSDIILKLKENR